MGKKLSDFLEKEEEEETVKTEVGTEEKSHGLVTISGGNYQDYFKKKMAELKARGKQTYNEDAADATENESEEDLDFVKTGFQSAPDTPPADTPLDTPPASPEDSSDQQLSEKKKKKKSKKSKKDNEPEPTEEEIVEEPETEKNKRKKSKKSKKKKKKKKKKK